MKQDKNIKALTGLATICTMTIDYCNDLDNRNIWKQKLKQKGRQFLKEFEKFEIALFDNCDEKDKLALTEQLSNNAEGIENIMNMFLNCKNDNQRNYLNEELEKLYKKFNLDNNNEISE